MQPNINDYRLGMSEPYRFVRKNSGSVAVALLFRLAVCGHLYS